VAHILLVEDDEDTLQLLSLALRQKGHRVQAATDGRRGLEAIRNGAYDLIVSDYDLPEMTGAQMLRAAVAERILRRASVLVVTAHPAPEGVDGLRLMAKPLELDRFVAQVEHILGTRRPVPPPSGEAASAPAVEMVLYVGENPASVRAQRLLHEALETFSPGQVRLTVVDVGRDPTAAEPDRIVFLPTLVVKGGASAWIVGDLGAPGTLDGLLAMCGLGAGAS
jgi:DNA-binding response OmpR family regulator